MTSATTKKCNGCGKTKKLNQFYLQNGRPRHLCKPCTSLYNAAQTLKHKAKRNEYDRARGTGWERSGREKWEPSQDEKHDSHLRRVYGITLNQYNEMLEAQGSVCAICRQTCNRWTTKRLCVDHDHDTGEVRGLLCFQCNVGLGKFKENVKHLQSAVQYLEKKAA